jgi:hypothetical protein
MSLGNWGESLLRDAAGAFFGSEYLRDYTHASKTFRTNSYEYTPKFKFLFHTYFEINPEAYSTDGNLSVLVKEIKLPSFTMQTAQMNQYNRKRIVQTKIKYDPVEIAFHDDSGDNVTKMWEAYYRYYYNDPSKPGQVLQGARGNNSFFGELGTSTTNYNDRNIYTDSTAGEEHDWGFSGGSTYGGKKLPFFKNITVFGLNQHNFTAYTLVNPMITNFAHDQYNYAEGNGVMQNRMTIDYETVVYNYGNLDGRNPGDIVTGFGSETDYDRTPSPIMVPGANGTVLGQGGLVDAVGGAIDSLLEGNVLDAIQTAGRAYNSVKNTNLLETAALELENSIRNTLSNTPNNRNALFSIPGASQTPGLLGLAGSPTIGASSSPKTITDEPTAGTQFNGTNFTGVTGFPIEAPFGGNFNVGPDGTV